jgi:hypothetical protein
MLQVFGDESHDPKNERVFAVAALFGTEAQWCALTDHWNSLLGGRIFHATDCETNHGEFALTSHSDNLKLYRDLTKVLAESGLLGYGSAMDLAGHREFFPDVLDDAPYYRCFKDVIYQCGKWAKWSVPADKVEFHFDQRLKSDYNAGVLYSHMASLADWDCSPFLGGTLKTASRANVGIQAADLYAREVMKHLDNILGPIKRPMRKSLEALKKTNRFGCALHLRDYFKDFRAKFDHISSQVGMSRDQYRDWLQKHGQVDSISSRNLYLIDLDNNDL